MVHVANFWLKIRNRLFWEGKKKDIRANMVYRSFILTLAFMAFFAYSYSQYYYKDILVPRQTGETLSKYKAQKVRNVRLESFEADGEPTEGFKGTQNISNNYKEMVTSVESMLGGASQLTSYFDGTGRLIRTADTTDGAGSTTEYSYNEKGLVMRVVNISRSAGGVNLIEEHIWTHDTLGRPLQMSRIKNSSDTTTVTFVFDEKGNVAEENSVRHGNKLPGISYFYDGQNRLTDIAAYNPKAQRLLPLYVFEYSEQGLISSMMVVPEGSDDYQTWHYTYNDAGLKMQDVCYDKRKQMLGKIEYKYEK